MNLSHNINKETMPVPTRDILHNEYIDITDYCEAGYLHTNCIAVKDKTVYAIFSDRYLYKSEDEGKTWIPEEYVNSFAIYGIRITLLTITLMVLF